MRVGILVDTGSGGTILSVDKVAGIGLQYEPDELVHRIRGVGGSEFVFSKVVDRLSLDELQASTFEVEVGAMDYGFPMDGIVGMDFLLQTGAIIDLGQLDVS
jgi:hypothetical protein